MLLSMKMTDCNHKCIKEGDLVAVLYHSEILVGRILQFFAGNLIKVSINIDNDVETHVYVINYGLKKLSANSKKRKQELMILKLEK